MPLVSVYIVCGFSLNGDSSGRRSRGIPPSNKTAIPYATGDVRLSPNISGSPGRVVGYASEEASGCFTRSNTGAAELSSGYGITSADIAFQANLSSPIYGGSELVQPSSLIALACIKT